jgi:acetyl esterase/lipase
MIMFSRRKILLDSIALTIGVPAFAQTPPPAGELSAPKGLPQPAETIDLWPNGAPGMPARALLETVNERSTDSQISDRAVFGISNPRMAVFRPAVSNGAAIVITPGGGYKWVVMDKEGYELARWLAARGFTVFVLFYRLPGEGWAAGPDVALADGQRAIRLVRQHAGRYGINPDCVALMGFSAGGHVCADVATRFAVPAYEPADAADTLSARPTLAAPIYPVISMTLPTAHPGSRELLLGADASPELERAHSPQHNVPPNAPPFFLVHAEDDESVVVENTLLLRAALRAKNIPTETHLFANGGHGFGLRKALGKPAAIWPELFVAWAATMGLI